MGRMPDGKKFTTPGLGRQDYRAQHREGFLAGVGRRDAGYYVWSGKRRGNPLRKSTLIGVAIAVVVAAIVAYGIWGQQIFG